MGNCQGNKEESGGFLNLGYSLWARAVSIQAAAGITLFYIGYQGGGFTEIEDAMKTPSKWLLQGWKVMEVMGIVHIVMSAVVGLFAILGYFLSNCFFTPLCIINAFETIFCTATFGVCKFYLNHGFNFVENYYNSLLDPSKKHFLPKMPLYESKLQEKTLEIVVAGTLSLATIAHLNHAASAKSSDSPNEISFVVLSTALSSAIGAMLLLPSNIKSLIIMGALWIAFATLTGMLYGLATKCCSKRIGSLTLGIILILVAVFSVATMSILGLWYVKGRRIDNQIVLAISVSALDPIKVDEKTAFLIYQAMEQGTLMLFALLLTVSQFYVSVFGSLFSIRYTFFNESSN